VGDRFKTISFIFEFFDECLENPCGQLSVKPDLSLVNHVNAFNKLFVTQFGSEKPPRTFLHHRYNVFLIEALTDDDNFCGSQSIPIVKDFLQIHGRRIPHYGLIQEENVRPLRNHLLHEGDNPFHIIFDIFDDDGAEEIDVLFFAQAICKLLQIIFITSYYGQFDHLLPPNNIYIAGLPPEKLNLQKMLSL
jgi:hypothetical protein